MATERCPGHTDGRHIHDGMGGCYGEGCTYQFPGPNLTTTRFPQQPERHTMNLNLPTEQERAAAEARQRDDHAKGYEAFKAQPAAKLLISMVPATEPPELLDTLMRSAFEAGCNTGAAGVGMELARAMDGAMKDMLKGLRDGN